MKTVRFSSQFKKDFKRFRNQPRKVERLLQVVRMLENEEPIPQEMKPHMLTGNYYGRGGTGHKAAPPRQSFGIVLNAVLTLSYLSAPAASVSSIQFFNSFFLKTYHHILHHFIIRSFIQPFFIRFHPFFYDL